MKRKPNIVNFSKILQNRKSFIVIFPNEFFYAYELMQYLDNLSLQFDRCVYLFPVFSYPFFKTIKKRNGVNIKEKAILSKKHDYSLVLDFSINGNRLCKNLSKSAYMSYKQSNNMEFLPPPSSDLDMIKILSNFFDIEFKKTDIEFRIDKKMNIDKLLISKNKNVTFYFKYASTVRRLNKNIVKFLDISNDYSLFCFGKKYFLKFNRFYYKINLDLLKIVYSAKKSKYFFTDDMQLVNLLNQLNINHFYIGKEKSLDININHINPVNFNEFKKIVSNN